MHNIPKRLHYLDVLRGFAAFAVVFYHWQHFFFNGTELGVFDHSRQPFYRLLSPFYEEGLRSVQLFFCLSGFVFFWLYSERIAERKVNLADFALLRFSRLYPLHLATLILVMVGQIVFRANYGTFFVYQFNDAYHFLLNLFFASSWGFQRGWSFNGPVWSVSIEILLYTIFALTCFFGFRRWWHLAFFVVLSYILTKVGDIRIERIAEASMIFFTGGLVFKLFLYAHRRKFLWGKEWVLALFCVSMWAIVAFFLHNNLIFRSLHPHKHGLLMVHGKDVAGFLANEIAGHLYNLFLFPLTIISLALIESYKGSIGERFTFIGEASYSSYLLHFPLQLVFYGTSRYLQLDRSVFYSPITLILFFAVLIPLSVLTHRYFEIPAQDKLRKRFRLMRRVT